jgi:hypothetical protein
MSWQDQIDNVIFTIITGDGVQYQPKWRGVTRDIEFNSALFEFVNVKGTLVLRQEPKGQKINLEFYFDGDNYIQNATRFVNSTNSKKYWTVQHPIYGNFICQPISISQDDNQLNCSKFSIQVVVTLPDVYPISMPIIENKISESVTATNEKQASTYANSGEINKTGLKFVTEYLDTTYSKIFKTNADILAFKKHVSNTIIDIESATGTPLLILRQMIALINYPATIEQTIVARINTFEETLNTLFTGLDNSRENKFMFESLGGAMIGAILLSSSTNITDDYEIRSKVLAIQARISSIYSTFLTRLDSLQTDRADSDTSYIPNFDSMNSLNEAVNYTISNLFNIAFTAKQEREYTVDYDTNLILLTHRFYGLDLEDANIEKFIKTNNIGLNEMLCISKGRKIIYYV